MNVLLYGPAFPGTPVVRMLAKNKTCFYLQIIRLQKRYVTNAGILQSWDSSLSGGKTANLLNNLLHNPKEMHSRGKS